MSSCGHEQGPLVSVIIPCHNQGQFVAEAVESALSQRRVTLEVVVVDDGSTDSTQDALGRFGEKIRVVRKRQPAERGAARNSGARAARGDLLAFLDADDRWLPGKLAAQVPRAIAGQACVTGWKAVDSRGRLIRVCKPQSATSLIDVLFHNPGYAPSTLMLPRTLFMQIGGFPEEITVQGSEDWLILVKLLASGAKITALPDVLLCYRVHDQQSTASPARRSASMWAAVDWIEEHGYVHGKSARRLRARTAGVVAAGFAFQGQPEDALSWVRRAGRQRVASETGRALGLTAASLVTGWLRRRGYGSLLDRVRTATG